MMFGVMRMGKRQDSSSTSNKHQNQMATSISLINDTTSECSLTDAVDTTTSTTTTTMTNGTVNTNTTTNATNGHNGVSKINNTTNTIKSFTKNSSTPSVSSLTSALSAVVLGGGTEGHNNTNTTNNSTKSNLTSSLSTSSGSGGKGTVDNLISVYNFRHENYYEETIGKDDCVGCAEDLVLKMCLQILGVRPVAVHLFGLYHRELKLWLAPDQPLATLARDLKTREMHSRGGGAEVLQFQLKIRFLPFSPKYLWLKDPEAFEYYFYQIRDDFRNFPKRKFTEQEEQQAYAIAIQDELREVIEKHIDAKANVRSHIDHIYKCLPESMQAGILQKANNGLLINLNVSRYFYGSIIRDKVEAAFLDSYEKQHKADYIKYCYIEQFFESLGQEKHYYDEVYEVVYFNPKLPLPANAKLLTYRVREEEVCIKSKLKDIDQWDRLFTISDLMYIDVLNERAVRISHNVGPPVDFRFTSPMEMRSFVSLLAGYYRLTERWNFHLGNRFFSPLIDKMRKMCCHGPVSIEFTKEKLNKFSDSSSGGGSSTASSSLTTNSHNNNNNNNNNLMKHANFIFQQSEHDFTVYYIVFQEQSMCIQVEVDLRRTEPLFQLPNHPDPSNGGAPRVFPTHQALFDYVRSIRPGASALIPLESDLPLNLLLCRDHKKERQKRLANRTDQLRVIQPDEVNKTSICMDTNLFRIHYGDIRRETEVLIKEFVNSERVGAQLADISKWVHLHDHSIVNCKGVILSPFSILFEFCPYSLQERLQSGMHLNQTQLIQGCYSLAKALDYLYTKEFVHGFIRFENLFVAHCNEKSLHLKLGDPIGHLNYDPQGERPWLPPEYYEPRSPFFGKLTFQSDVYAFGTTVWQIFNEGRVPQLNFPDYQNQNFEAIHPDVASVIEQCWARDINKRMQPYSILGQLSKILCAATYEPMALYQEINQSGGGGGALDESNSQMIRSSTPDFSANGNRNSNQLANCSASTIMAGSIGGHSINGSQINGSSLSLNPNLSSLTGNIRSVSSVGGGSGGKSARYRDRFSNLFNRGSSKNALSMSNASLNTSRHSLSTDTTSVHTATEDLTGADFSIYDPSVVEQQGSLCQIDNFNHTHLKSFESIGSGCYGNVYKAVLKRAQHEPTEVAVKIIDDKGGAQGADHEMNIMIKLKHPNIVQILGYCFIEKRFLPPMKSTDNSYFKDASPDAKLKGLVMEYMRLGSLDHYLKMKYKQGELGLPFIKFAIDIAEGMNFLSSVNVLHRDLAARNILLKSAHEVKLSDFGLSHIVENDLYRLTTDRLIPMRRYAPESISRGEFRTKSDVWSYGMLLWEMYSFCKSEPLDSIGDTSADLHLYLAASPNNRPAKPNLCPGAMYAIMQSCWEYNVDKRPAFHTILQQLKELQRVTETCPPPPMPPCAPSPLDQPPVVTIE